MRTPAGFLRQVSCAVAVAVMAITIGVPAAARDEPRDRMDGDPVVMDDGDGWSRQPVVEPLGVEWTF